MVFGRDRIRGGFRNALNDLDVRHVEFVAPWRALVGANFTLYDHARFLREALDGVEEFGRHSGFWGYPLDDAGAVTKLREEELAAFAQVVEPSADGDGLAFVLAYFCDRADGRSHNNQVFRVDSQADFALRSEMRGQIAEVK